MILVPQPGMDYQAWRCHSMLSYFLVAENFMITGFFVLFFSLSLSLSPPLPLSDRVSLCYPGCSLKLLGSSDPPASASQVPETTGAYYHNWVLIFSRDEILLCSSCWSHTPGLEQSFYPAFQKCWDDRCKV